MSPYAVHHDQLLAACVAQSQALLQGKTIAKASEELRRQGYKEEDIALLAPHKVVLGNKPSNTILIERLTPKNLGALIAFYEHKVYTLSLLFNVNAFDQWGVELGKELGEPIFEALQTGELNTQWDASTQQLINYLLSK